MAEAAHTVQQQAEAQPSSPSEGETSPPDFYALDPSILKEVLFIPYRRPDATEEDKLMDMNVEGADILASALRVELASLLAERGLYSTFGLDLSNFPQESEEAFEALSGSVAKEAIEEAGLDAGAFTRYPPRLVMEADLKVPLGSLAIGPKEVPIVVAKWRHVRSAAEIEEVVKEVGANEEALGEAAAENARDYKVTLESDSESSGFGLDFEGGPSMPTLTLDPLPDEGAFLLCAVPQPNLFALFLQDLLRRQGPQEDEGLGD